MASDALHRHATRSWPKAFGSRLYGSLSALLGISRGLRKDAQSMANDNQDKAPPIIIKRVKKAAHAAELAQSCAYWGASPEASPDGP